LQPLEESSDTFTFGTARHEGELIFLTRRHADLAAILDEFTDRYPNRNTARKVRRILEQLFRHSGRQRPAELTENDITSWATHGNPANNSVYSRVSTARTFLKWCQRNDYVSRNVTEGITDSYTPLATYHRTYGGVQAKNPKRWLDHHQAYDVLIAHCQDGTDIGLRDELVIRLGLMGMRAAEIGSLTVANLRQLPVITWTGKGRKPRQATAGPSLIACLTKYLDQYRERTGCTGPLAATLPLLCRQVQGTASHGTAPQLQWGQPMAYTTLWNLITKRAQKAGLGHVAPHDLRRTAAGILHRATDEHGAHHFDLLDIQKVLGHSDPATTMRSYLDPMDTDVLDRASLFLD
jgi:integrase